MSDSPIFDVARAYGTPDIIGVLLSGGVDSATTLYEAAQTDAWLIAIGINYGQRHVKELEAAERLADAIDAEQVILDLSSVIPNTTLKDGDALIPSVSYADLKGVSPTYVPFRNGLMISAATSYLVGRLEKAIAAEELPPNAVAHLYAGMHAEDAAAFAYPDCTPEFAGSMANAIFMGTYGKVRLITPFINSDKSDIVKRGQALGVPYELTWSCYKGEELHCGVCPTCRARREALSGGHSVDPYTEYAAEPNDKEEVLPIF